MNPGYDFPKATRGLFLGKGIEARLPPYIESAMSGGLGMKFYDFRIVIEKDDETGGYYAWSPTLPGCFSNGVTIEAASANMREAVEQHVSVLIECGDPIPQEERAVHVEVLSLGVPA